MVGGLLVSVAVLGTWWTTAGADRRPTDRYVVAARSVGPGQRLTADDLRLAPVELGDALRSRAYADPRPLVGAVALGPFEPGDLVQSGAVAPADASPDGPRSRELSFAVDASWALAGSLRPGDRIDVLVTYGEGAASTTGQVLADAVVARIDTTGGEGLGQVQGQTLTVTIDDPELVQATVNAARAGSITVVRATGAAAAAEQAPYRAADHVDGGAEPTDDDPTGGRPSDGGGG